MIERDYIMRLIREFMAALQRLLEKKEVEERRQETEKLYAQYFGAAELWRNASVPEILANLKGSHPADYLYRLDMLANLFYTEAGMVSKPQADGLLEKAYALFDYIETHGRTYDMDRRKRMTAIKNKLNNP